MERSNSGGSRTARRSGPNSQPTREPLYGLAFSPDGRTLGTVGANGAVRLWDLGFHEWQPAEWQAVGCRLVRRNLSMTEWQQLVPGKDYQRTCAEFPSGPGAPSPAPAATYSRLNGR